MKQRAALVVQEQRRPFALRIRGRINLKSNDCHARNRKVDIHRPRAA